MDELKRPSVVKETIVAAIFKESDTPWSLHMVECASCSIIVGVVSSWSNGELSLSFVRVVIVLSVHTLSARCGQALMKIVLVLQ